MQTSTSLVNTNIQLPTVTNEQGQANLATVSLIKNNWYSRYCSLVSKVKSTFNWLREYNFGISKLLAYRLISAQITSIPWFGIHSPEVGRKIIDQLCNSTDQNNYHFEKITVPNIEGNEYLTAVICYPPNWDKTNNSECIVYNNQNGTTISQHITENKLVTTADGDSIGTPRDTPGNYQAYKKCPIILYDYKGTGINQDTGISRMLPTADAKTIANNAEDVIRYALSKFKKVHILGSSMGGYAANKGVAQHLENINDRYTANQVAKQIHIINHDSFSGTSETLIPTFPNFAKSLGCFLGAHADSISPMLQLMKYPLTIDILSHRDDKIIPRGARMIDAFDKIQAVTESDIPTTEYAKVNVFESPNGPHSCLSQDQLKQL
jgi:hypothetical protein